VPPLGPRWARWTVLATAILMSAISATGVVRLWRETGATSIDTRDPSSNESTFPSMSDYFRVDGRTPTAFPDVKLGLGFLALDDPLARAVETLGSAAATEPDIIGTAHMWNLPGGAVLTISTWDDTQEIGSLHAVVPTSSPTRLSAFGGIVLGQSSLRDAVAAWGGDFTSATSPVDDYVVRYIECVGEHPVVVKFGQTATTDDGSALAPGSPQWDEPVTALLIAFADEPPGSSGCGS
jgi:hypothetical protein